MTGKTHVNLGFLAALTLKVPMPISPAVFMMVAFNILPAVFRLALLVIILVLAIVFPLKGGMFFIPLALVLGCIFLDLDHPNSTLSRMIAPTTAVIHMLLVAVGGTLWWQHEITWFTILGYLAFVLFGMFNLLSETAMEKLQRILLLVAGGLLIYWSPNKLILALGALYLIMGVLSHRGLTHSPEGLGLTILGAWLFTKNLGHPELLYPFALGCITHLLADLFADHGIYATYIGKVKVSIPLVRTSSITEKGLGLVAMFTAIAIIISHMGSVKVFISLPFKFLQELI